MSRLALVALSGSQHLLQHGDIIKTDRVLAEVGSTYSINGVIGEFEGNEFIKNTDSSVVANFTVLEHKRSKKIIVFKQLRRKNSQKKKGHRSLLSVLKFDGIVS